MSVCLPVYLASVRCKTTPIRQYKGSMTPRHLSSSLPALCSPVCPRWRKRLISAPWSFSLLALGLCCPHGEFGFVLAHISFAESFACCSLKTLAIA